MGRSAAWPATSTADGAARWSALSSHSVAVLGNVDPTVLFGSEAQVTAAVHQNIRDAGGKGQHLLNLGHGVLQGTPEASVAAFVNAAKSFTE